MDFVFHCSSCSGPLIARIELRGRLLRCSHCACGTPAPSAVTAITEAVVSRFLDQRDTGEPRVLRRVRPAPQTRRFTSSRSLPALPRSARISPSH